MSPAGCQGDLLAAQGPGCPDDLLRPAEEPADGGARQAHLLIHS